MATDATLAQPEDLIEGGLDVLHRKALTILKRIRDSAVDPETGSKRGPTFPISKAAALVGRTASAIREAERDGRLPSRDRRSEEHTSELQSLMRISYAVFCLKKKKHKTTHTTVSKE